MFNVSCLVINTVSKDGTNYSQRGDIDSNAAYMVLTSFEFILILHLMKDTIGITNMLGQILQQKFRYFKCRKSSFNYTITSSKEERR
jgi:hypothetical protein